LPLLFLLLLKSNFIFELQFVCAIAKRYNKRCTSPENRKDLGRALKNPFRPSRHDLKVQEDGAVQETYTEEDNHFRNGNQLRHYQLSGLNWMLWNWKNQR
jgi:hypothetical protein